MRRIIQKSGLIILLLLIGISANSFTLKTSENHSSLVIVKIAGLNADVLNKINKGISKNASMSLEYSCLQSNVIVVKYLHSFSEKADVQHYINSNFKKWGRVKNIEFIFIDLQTTGISKC